MKCPNCNKEVTDDTKFCPECGHNFSQPQQETPVQQQEQSKPEKKKKKPLWLKIVIAIVCLFVLFSMLGSCSDSSDSSQSLKVETTSTSPEIEETIEETTVVVDSNTSSNSSQKSNTSSYDETKSNSENSNKSTPINIYTNLSKYATVGSDWEGFKVSPKAKKFISEHPDLFPAVSDAVCIDYVNYSLEFKHLSRDIEEYGDSMVCMTGDITDIKPIKPEKTGLNDTITEIKMSVENPDKGLMRDTYYVYYIGSLDFYIGDEITFYGVPMDIQYEQPIIAASYVEIFEAG